MTFSRMIFVSNEDIRSSRLAREILDCVRSFPGTVFIEKDGRKIQANSLIGILSLGIEFCDELKITCMGSTEKPSEALMDEIEKLLVLQLSWSDYCAGHI